MKKVSALVIGSLMVMSTLAVRDESTFRQLSQAKQARLAETLA
jgi:hypothetical protein